MNRLAIHLALIVAVLLLVGCSSQPAYQQKWTEVSAHMPDADSKAEHDDVEAADGAKTEFYPNRQTPQRIVYRFPQGGIIDSHCLTGELHCHHWEMKVTGFRPGHQPPGFHIDMSEGTYTLTTTTEDPWVAVMKDEGQITVGYWVNNRNGHGIAVVKTYAEAETLRDYKRAGD